MSSVINPTESLVVEDSFDPHGLKVLLVDDNPPSIFHLSTLLRSCHYQVTTCTCPTDALSLIKSGESKFDFVITETKFSPDINGIEFLETIVGETDSPVVVVSADERIDTITECITKGACTYIPKPAKIEVIQMLWQHVARKEMLRMKQIDNLENNETDSSNTGEDKEVCASSDGVPMEDEQNKVQAKKRRVVWTDELHEKFVYAVKQLGIRNAVPKKIMELMNEPGLRRENIASHLQKYRLHLGKQAAQMQENSMVRNFRAQVPSGACNSVIEDNDWFAAQMQETFRMQNFGAEVPSGACNSVIGDNDLFKRSPSINEMQAAQKQEAFLVQNSRFVASNGACNSVVGDNDLFLESLLINEMQAPQMQEPFMVENARAEVPSGTCSSGIGLDELFSSTPPISEAKALSHPVDHLIFHDPNYSM